MKTLENADSIKKFFIDHINYNLKKINSDSLILLMKNIDLNVYANSENKTLNQNFNSLIRILKRSSKEDDVSIYTLTEFYYYYDKILKETNLTFTSSL